MAKTFITHSCGHDEEHDLLGPTAQRERKIAWLETTLCSDCQQVENDKRNKIAAQWCADNECAPLTGSEKQIAWAESIRADYLQGLNGMLTILPADQKPQLVEAIADIKQHDTDASWWIDNRDEPFMHEALKHKPRNN